MNNNKIKSSTITNISYNAWNNNNAKILYFLDNYDKVCKEEELFGSKEELFNSL